VSLEPLTSAVDVLAQLGNGRLEFVGLNIPQDSLGVPDHDPDVYDFYDRERYFGQHDLEDLTLLACRLYDCNFELSNLSRARIEAVSFQGSCFAGTRFANAHMTDVDFSRCGLRGASLRGATLEQVLFHETDLRETDWGDTKLGRVIFIDVDLAAAIDAKPPVRFLAPSTMDVAPVS
jgi:uncharacterized protein YjbI with pentapeptide repeats